MSYQLQKALTPEVIAKRENVAKAVLAPFLEKGDYEATKKLAGKVVAEAIVVKGTNGTIVEKKSAMDDNYFNVLYQLSTASSAAHMDAMVKAMSEAAQE